MSKPSQTDKVIWKFKNSTLGGAVVLVVIAVIAVGEFTDAIDKIGNFFSGDEQSASDAKDQSDTGIDRSIGGTPLGSDTQSKEFVSMSLAEFIDEYENLDGRFVEQEAFIEQLIGKWVSWQGYVYSVSLLDSGTVTLWFTSEPFPTGTMKFARFDENLKTRLFSLRRGDRIRVEGEFQANSSDPRGWIAGHSVMLLKPDDKK